jgi:hypothetical protein
MSIKSKINAKRIIFFCSSPFTERDFMRYGGKVLKENGFDVWFYDFSPITYPKLYQNCTFPDLYQPENYILCSDMDKALKAIDSIPSDSLIIMTLIFGPDTYKIFQAITKAKTPFCSLINNSLPSWEEQINFGKFNRILKNIKKVFSMNTDSFKKKIYRPQFSHLWGIRRADFCIVAGETSLETHKTRYLIGKNTEIIWAHAFDYDIHLKGSAENTTPRNQAVFLSSLFPLFQGDSLAHGYKASITAEKYFPSICIFFNHIEKELDIKIEIAAHPKSNHPLYPDYLGNRRTLRGETYEMIKNSQFVINHMSSSIQFAILLKKPILFLITNELEKDTRYSYWINTFALAMNKNVINIDKPFSIDIEKELYVNEKIYDDYIHRHIKKRGSEELNTWQILANRLKRD